MKDAIRIDDFFSDLSVEEKLIRVTAFQSILKGSPSTIDDLHGITELPQARINGIVENLAKNGRIVVDIESGTIVGSQWLSLIKTSHRLYINDRNLFTWCAFDAIGIPAALEVDAQINSTCFSCEKEINIEIISGQISKTSEQDIKLLLVEAEFGRPIVGCT